MCTFSTQLLYCKSVHIYGLCFNTHNLGTTTLNLFISTSNIFSPHFHKKSKKKNSTIETLWGTVISPFPKKGTVQYSTKITVPLDTLLKWFLHWHTDMSRNHFRKQTCKKNCQMVFFTDIPIWRGTQYLSK